jgi:uncharacterized protein YegL
MKKGLTELVFILDRSGSMNGLVQETIKGYNAFIQKQKNEPGEAVVTTVLFDDHYELLHDRIQLKGIKPITEKEYFVRGYTALLDAIGKTIRKIENAQKNTADEEKAEHVMFVIMTDGMENASRELNYTQVRQMIEHQKNTSKWEFIFLGANIDALATAQDIGIKPDRAANYHADSIGTKLNYEVLSDAVSHMRANHSLSADWKDKIDADFKKRGNKK